MSSLPHPGGADGDPGANAMTDRFRQVARGILAEAFDGPPAADGAPGSPAAGAEAAADAERIALLSDALGALDEIDDTMLPPDAITDLEMLRTRVGARMWRTAELRPYDWDPLEVLPAPPSTAAESAAVMAAAAQLPDALSGARARLDTGPGMPRVHTEAAAGRARALARALRAAERDAADAGDGGAAADAAEAVRALQDYAAWLDAAAPTAVADPRLGGRVHAAALWYGLDTETAPGTLLTRAESDLIALEEQLAEEAAAAGGSGGSASPGAAELAALLAEGAAAAPLGPPAEEFDRLRRAAEAGGRFTVPDAAGPPPWPLAWGDPLTEAAPAHLGGEAAAGTAPVWADGGAAPGAGPDAAGAGVLLRAAAARSGVPGRALQGAHAAAAPAAASEVRAVLADAPFTAGWASFAASLAAEQGAELPAAAERAWRIADLVLRLRDAVDTVLAVGAHDRSLTEEEGVRLAAERGRRSPADAAAAWRRALLGGAHPDAARPVAAHLGRHDIAALAGTLAAERPDLGVRARHDALLSHRAPPPRYLRFLLGL